MDSRLALRILRSVVGMFDFLDGRISIARWAAKWFREGERNGFRNQEIVALSLAARFGQTRLTEHQALAVSQVSEDVSDIFDLCYLVAQVELLGHLSAFEEYSVRVGDKSIRDHTFQIIDKELERLGFRRDSAPNQRAQQECSGVSTAAQSPSMRSMDKPLEESPGRSEMLLAVASMSQENNPDTTDLAEALAVTEDFAADLLDQLKCDGYLCEKAGDAALPYWALTEKSRSYLASL